MHRHGTGRLPSPPDPRDHPLARYLAVQSASALPLRPPTRPRRVAPYDQGDTPRCVGYSGALGRELTEVEDLGGLVRFDPNDLYALAKQRDGSPNADGTYIRAAAQGLLEVGALVARGRPAFGVHKGDRLKIASYARLQSHEEIKTAILAESPGFVWIGSTWFNSWFNPISKGLLDNVLPAPDSPAGGHAYSLIYYNDLAEAYLAQNSWGRHWGDAGRFWLPYQYVDFNDVDAWRTFDVPGDR